LTFKEKEEVMEEITYEEYVSKHKKMTKVERAHYEKCCGYNSRLRDDELLEEMNSLTKRIQKLKESLTNK
jgi:hypothetical protein